MYKRILIATDGSPLSQNAIANGVAIARATGATVIGFHARAAKLPAYYGEAAVMLPPEVDTALDKESMAIAERCLAEIGAAAKQASVPFKPVHYPSASPADAILETAEKERCDLIVMASHGRKGLSRMLLGSETIKVVTHARVPVMVTH